MPGDFQVQQPQAGRQVHAALQIQSADASHPSGRELRYLLFLPNAYQPDGDTWPLLLFLHGAGERGDNLELVKKHGPPKLVESRPDFPFIVASPQ